MSSKPWVFLTPISNLKLTKAVDNEIKIDRVTFIEGEKLSRVRNRLGIKKKNIKHIDERIKSSNLNTTISSLVSKHDTFALIRQTGTKENVKPICFRKVKDELLILNLSRLFLERRKYSGFLSLEGTSQTERTTHILIDSNSTAHNLGFQLITSPIELELDKKWKDYHKNFFFLKLIKILSGKTNVASEWKKSLRRAAIFAGKSLNTNNVADALLWNVIALESLLTNKGESISTVLIERMRALIGWHNRWEQEHYEDKIKAAYNLRSTYVHDGDEALIDKKILVFTDKLIFNVFWNLVVFPNVFYSKTEVIKFADRIKALNTLGYKRPKKPNLKFADKTYSSEQIKLI